MEAKSAHGYLSGLERLLVKRGRGRDKLTHLYRRSSIDSLPDPLLMPLYQSLHNFLFDLSCSLAIPPSDIPLQLLPTMVKW
jgi:hypothetical protein